MQKRFITIILTLCMILAMGSGFGYAATEMAGLNPADVLDRTGDYLMSVVTDPVCDGIGGEWVIYGMSVADYDMPLSYLEKYKSAVETKVKAGYRGIPGVLHDRKYTDYSRVIYTYGNVQKYAKSHGYAIEFDPTNVAGFNLLEKLADFDKANWQGLNGTIWALQALDSNCYEMPKLEVSESTGTVQATRDKYIDYILKYQHDDGGWSLDINDMTTVSDPDMTGMAVQALAGYRNKTKVKKALDKAVSCMSKMQNPNGTYSTWGAETSESCAQILMALSRLGIDGATDSGFVKNGNSVVDGLLSFYDNSVGGFRHVNVASGGYEAVVNQMATEQGYYALANYEKYIACPYIKSAKSSKTKELTVSIENPSLMDGVSVVISTSKTFKKGTTTQAVLKTSASKKTLSKTFKSLKKGKKYYVKARAYRMVDGKKVYGKYTAVKTVTVK